MTKNGKIAVILLEIVWKHMPEYYNQAPQVYDMVMCHNQYPVQALSSPSFMPLACRRVV